MNEFLNWVSQPWPWYIAGPMIGLTVPILLIIGNRSFGISSSLRHVCAVCVPAKIPFFQYNWKEEIWNLMFVTGVFLGGVVAALFLSNPETIVIAESTQRDLRALGLTDFNSLLPAEIFSWEHLLTLKGFFFMVVGGFLVGFGTRYAGGCTSGHAIMGISNLQWPSVVATVFFMIGGLVMTHLLLPFIMTWVGF
ncbi:YeeE/YedE thiosulfate transporter family protein [Cyclobacterium sp. 1_MG-2023]|uniref:YeeE/YedE family protein n=1 Tax=Cyclobacterium sp. 1_MG-2023 TaxID=3062681 RepID=UPI0026E245D5|nr:YeeE/YedE thiosulfate transporter family protein [Cyclobacterium sp. 1_MG-2023]MDO6437233.1 YeeE/YedE thiosulfate transporter family protein [Cyclobacterium sp. 1_MG-2023]